MTSRLTDEQLIVVPDTHGHLPLVETLIAYCRKQRYLEDHRLVFLGDYFDRGPCVRELIEFCIELKKGGHAFIAGNHDYTAEMILQEHELRPQWIERWARNYEDQTLASYGAARPRGGSSAAWFRAANDLRAAMPKSHLDFLASLPFFLETDNCIFVHAGLHPQEPWIRQRRSLSRTNLAGRKRGPAQLFSHALAYTIQHQADKIVVSGHAALVRPHIGKKRILLNCGVDYGGPLVAWIADRGELVAAHPRRRHA